MVSLSKKRVRKVNELTTPLQPLPFYGDSCILWPLVYVCVRICTSRPLPCVFVGVCIEVCVCNVNLNVSIPLNKLQSSWAVVRILQIKVVIACKNSCYPIDEAVVWSITTCPSVDSIQVLGFIRSPKMNRYGSGMLNKEEKNVSDFDIQQHCL